MASREGYGSINSTDHGNTNSREYHHEYGRQYGQQTPDNEAKAAVVIPRPSVPSSYSHAHHIRSSADSSMISDRNSTGHSRISYSINSPPNMSPIEYDLPNSGSNGNGYPMQYNDTGTSDDVQDPSQLPRLPSLPLPSISRPMTSQPPTSQPLISQPLISQPPTLPSQPPTLPSQSHSSKCPRVCCIILSCMVVLVIVALVITAAAGLGLRSVPQFLHDKVKSKSHTIPLQGGQVGKFACFNTREGDNVTISQLHGVTGNEEVVSAHFALINVQDLIPRWDNHSQTSYGTNWSSNQQLQGLEPFAYMLNRSSLEISIDMDLLNTSSPIYLNEYNDFEKYNEFGLGRTNAPIPLRSWSINTTTPVLDTMTEDGFKFFGLYFQRPVSYTYTYNLHRRYYNASDYRIDGCTLMEGSKEQCRLTATLSSEQCVLAYTSGPSSLFYEVKYFTITERRSTFGIVMIGVCGALVALLVCLTLPLVIVCYCVCRR